MAAVDPMPRHGEEGCGGLAGTGVALDEEDVKSCLLYTSDAADERSSVDLGGRRIIQKKKRDKKKKKNTK